MQQRRACSTDGSPNSLDERIRMPPNTSRKLAQLVLRGLRQSAFGTPLGAVCSVLLLGGFCLTANSWFTSKGEQRNHAFLHRQGPVLGEVVQAQTDPADDLAGGLLVKEVKSPVKEDERIRGALPDIQHRYKAQKSAGKFECFDGSKVFPKFEVVNDDYCDCLDGSDEPGTSACVGIVIRPAKMALSGFSCGWSSGLDHGVVRFAAVNDGICDCCAGDDEWDGNVKCTDRCDLENAAKQEEESRVIAGAKARESYVERAKDLKQTSRWSSTDGGPDNVFLAEADNGCLKLDDGDYIYEVCLWDTVKQKGKNGRAFDLGRGGKWNSMLWEDGKTQRIDYSMLIMGDGEYCPPANAPRRAELLFECAVSSAVLSVQETQVCVYTFRLQTPAACRSLSERGA